MRNREAKVRPSMVHVHDEKMRVADRSKQIEIINMAWNGEKTTIPHLKKCFRNSYILYKENKLQCQQCH